MKNILLVDDNEQLRSTIANALSFEGYLVTQAKDGKVAMDLIVKKNFELVITDIIMPEIEGIGLIRWLRKKKPNVKIIAISGGNTNISIDDALTFCNIQGYPTLEKPFKIDVLFSTVKNVLNR